jgi:hypothetical protein
VARQHLHVARLSGAARLDGSATGADRRQIGQGEARIGTPRAQLDRGVDIAAGELMAALEPVVEPVQRQLRGLDLRRVPG